MNSEVSMIILGALSERGDFSICQNREGPGFLLRCGETTYQAPAVTLEVMVRFHALVLATEMRKRERANESL